MDAGFMRDPASRAVAPELHRRDAISFTRPGCQWRQSILLEDRARGHLFVNACGIDVSDEIPDTTPAMAAIGAFVSFLQTARGVAGPRTTDRPR